MDTLNTVENLDCHRSSVGAEGIKSAVQLMMLRKESGRSKKIEPIHAALGKDIDEGQTQVTSEESHIRNRAMLHYIATLADSNSETDTFNYNFVQSLIDGGAKLNEAVDMYGQTIFHEVARSWNLDIALFLINNGANLNQQDKYGRSPLHVCAAANHADMVEFLLQNGADIDSKSYGDEQTPLHYAAKNDATRSLNVLLGFGANIDSLDNKGRTALQVAAELSRSESVRVLIEEGASSCIYDTNGSSAMTVLIEKLPRLAVKALNQLQLSEQITRTTSFYLNVLEESRQNKATKCAFTPLETAVNNRRFDVVMHPVMQRLIVVKWLFYGRLGTIIDLAINFVHAILFTLFAIGTPDNGRELYSPLGSNVWRLFVGSFILAVTSYQMYLQIKTTYRSRKKQKSWIRWRLKQLNDDLEYCHPKWQEEKYVRDEMKIINNLPLLSTMDAWFFFDWFIIILILVTVGLNFSYYFVGTTAIKSAYMKVFSFLLIFVWLRILKYLRPFPGIGTLVLILGSTGGDFVNWGFFFMLLFIPFTSCFWIIFGGSSYNKVDTFSKGHRILYTMLQISLGEDFNIDGLVTADPVMARLLSSIFITLMVIVCLNILIAYLSNTFTRVYSKAVENTNMQRAINILNIEKFLTKKRLQMFYDHLRKNANPDVIPWSSAVATDTSTEKKNTTELVGNVRKTNEVLRQRFKKQVGKGAQSTFDILLNDVRKIKANQVGTVKDLMKIQTDLEDLGNFLGVDTSTSFNFSALLSSITMEQRDRSGSTLVAPREIDRGSKNVKRKVDVKTKRGDEYEEQRSTEEGNAGRNRPNIKGVVAKFTRSKPNRNDEGREDEEDDDEIGKESKTKRTGALSKLTKLKSTTKGKTNSALDKLKKSFKRKNVDDAEEMDEEEAGSEEDIEDSDDEDGKIISGVNLMSKNGRVQKSPSKKNEEEEYQARNPWFHPQQQRGSGNRSRPKSPRIDNSLELPVIVYHPPDFRSESNDGFAEEFRDQGGGPRENTEAWEKTSIGSVEL